MSTLSQKLDLRQSQQLVMTPQLQQAIKLLQLNNIELGEFVEEELEKNPLLEKDERGDGDSDIESPPERDSDPVREEIETAFQSSGDEGGEAGLDHSGNRTEIGSGGNSKFEDSENSFENRMSAEVTLRDHLSEQINLAFDDARDRLLAEMLCDDLDEAGYMRRDLKEVAERLGCSDERMERIYGRVRQFDPTGIFAADLADCLALQLEEKGALDQPMRVLLENLHVLAEHDHVRLAKLCGVNETYLADMVDEIKALSPRPASAFDHIVVQTAVPDVFMKRLPKNLGGGWRVELNNETLPRVLVNQEYYTEVSGVTRDKKDKEFLNEQLAAANWLIRALDQRAQTILKVAAAIVEEQDAFFNYGIEFLRPLTLKDIAEEIEMHESTVSRVTTNKYIGTPRGIFELKFFFSTALTAADGSSHSAEAVKARIKSLIDAENPKKILSDDAIVDKLKEEGIDIARRTVAKYREGMHIPSSVMRRKQKKNLAAASE